MPRGTDPAAWCADERSSGVAPHDGTLVSCLDGRVSVNLHAAVAAWLADSVPPELASHGFAQIDINDLLGQPPPIAARTGVLCLELAVILGRERFPDVDGMLTLELPFTDLLVHESPTIEEALSDSWNAPGLYLIEPHHWRGYEEVEEYRRHLPAQDFLPPEYAAYYRTWRTQEESTSGLEYNRAIYIRTVDDS